MAGPMASDEIERFRDSSIPEPNSGCFIWMKGLTGTGYGLFRAGSMRDGTRRCVTASRYACELAYGKIPDGMQALHKCDNKLCVNPDHLYIGSRSNNANDAFDRGRKIPHRMPGALNPNAKLTVDDVKQIRASSLSLGLLAKQFDVSKTQISWIKNGKSWAHVA